MFAQIAAWNWDTFLEPRTLVFVVMGVVGVSAIFIPNWRKVRQTEANTRLKHKMIERGFSADEIERVLNAGEAGASDNESSAST